MNQQQGRELPRLINAYRERRLASLLGSHRRASVAKKLTLAFISFELLSVSVPLSWGRDGIPSGKKMHVHVTWPPNFLELNLYKLVRSMEATPHTLRI